MNIQPLLIPAEIIGALGGLFALVLAFVARVFAVKKDERLAPLVEVLPSLNCGGCGFSSCEGYAEALLSQNNLAVSLCKPGGVEVAEALAALLGREVTNQERVIAYVHCHGGTERAADRYHYTGHHECRAAQLLKGGYKKCEQACLGFGDCVRACAFNALVMTEEGLPQVDRKACVGCGACVTACPRSLIELIAESKRVHVVCKNIDKAAHMVKSCSVGCIACSKCVAECPVDAIHVINNVAVIDYAKCISCSKCVKVCPRHIIFQLPK